jgi:hypothetical protein
MLRVKPIKLDFLGSEALPIYNKNMSSLLLRVFGDKALRITQGPKREEVTGIT